MAEIPKTLGEGGAHLSPRGNGKTSLLDILVGLRADLAAVLGDAPDDLPEPADPPDVAQGAATPLGAFTDGPTAGEMANLRTQFNALNTRVTQVLARVEGVYVVVQALSGAIEDLHAIQAARAEVELETTVEA